MSEEVSDVEEAVRFLNKAGYGHKQRGVSREWVRVWDDGSCVHLERKRTVYYLIETVIGQPDAKSVRKYTDKVRAVLALARWPEGNADDD